jgi:hypothetical protein
MLDFRQSGRREAPAASKSTVTDRSDMPTYPGVASYRPLGEGVRGHAAFGVNDRVSTWSGRRVRSRC